MAEYTIDKIEYGGNVYKLQDNVSGYTTNTGTVTGIKVNGTTKSPTSGIVDIGTLATSNTTYTLSGSLASHKFSSLLTPSTGNANGTDFTLAAGTGITITDDTSNRKMTIACTVTNTDTKVTTAALTSGTLYYPILATGTGTATRQIDSAYNGLTYKSTKGTTSTVGTAELTLGNNIASGTANNEQGKFILYGSTAYAHTIQGAPSAARTITLPDGTGTIALTSDIPYNIMDGTGDGAVRGRRTIAQRKSQLTIGEYNEADMGGTDENTRGDYAFIIGNGTDDDNRSNALTVDWNGGITLGKNSGGIYYAGTHNTTQMIRFLDNTAEEWGNGIVIGGGSSALGNAGGTVIIGGGESPNYIQEGLFNDGYTAGSELMAITSDDSIRFYSGAQNGYASAKLSVIDTNGYFIPALGLGSTGLNTAVILAEVTRADAMAQDSTLTTDSPDSKWIPAYIKAICAKYPNRSGVIFKCKFNPNSLGIMEVLIYNTSALSGGLPEASFGTIVRYDRREYTFGTTNYTFYIHATITCTIASGYTNYNSGVNPKVYRSGNVCTFKWVMKPTSNYTMNDTLKTICTIPGGYRPVDDVHLLCQGSGTSFFYTIITTGGAVQVARLRDVGNSNSSWSTATTTMWFPITATYVCAIN